MSFRIVVDYRPRGDQQSAIDQLVRGLHDGEQHQVLLGVTGSGKTFTMAKVIENLGRPALVLAHNKTLAAQLYHEFKAFFPHNSVEYFVSYYDYYQPEAYMPASDTYIEKEATINEDLDKLRMAATRSLFERRDCVIVASVSCIYGLGSPEAYYGMLLMLDKGQKVTRQQITQRLVEILYERTEGDFRRGTFRVRGDVIEVYPTYEDAAFRIELWGDEVDSLSQIDPVTGTDPPDLCAAAGLPEDALCDEPRDEGSGGGQHRERAPMVEWGAAKRGQAHRGAASLAADNVRPRDDPPGRLLPRHRNYSRHFTNRLPGEAPPTLLDYLPPDAMVLIDESHQTIPQLRGMYHGDRSRKETLVAHGFRLPSALDNRPLTFEEFENRVHQVITCQPRRVHTS
jgi:excinuclease ABC subunit B